jgi:hypothetical protein
MPLGRENRFYSFDVDFRIFFTAAMPYVHAELKHIKTIRHYFFSELRVVFPVFFCFGWQIKMY